MSVQNVSETMAPPESPKSRTGCILLGVGGGCLVVVLLCAGTAGLGVFGLFTAIKSSDPYTQSLARAQQEPSVQAELGQPIEAGFAVQGNINLDNNDGQADLNYSISGPEGSATVEVVGTKTAGQWDYETMTVTIQASGDVIDLLKE